MYKNLNVATTNDVTYDIRSYGRVSGGVEFCHSTRNASRIWQKVGNLTLGSLCLPCCVRDAA